MQFHMFNTIRFHREWSARNTFLIQTLLWENSSQNKGQQLLELSVMAVSTISRRKSMRVFAIFAAAVTLLPVLAFVILSISGDSSNIPAIPALRFHEASDMHMISQKQILAGVKCCECNKMMTSHVVADRVVQELETQERSRAFEKIFDTDFWGGGESRSGPGSRIDYTGNVRLLIAAALKNYNVDHMLDAPCGGNHINNVQQLYSSHLNLSIQHIHHSQYS